MHGWAELSSSGGERSRCVSQSAGIRTASSIGDEKWWTVFQDEELQKLIRAALEQNYDVRIAATRILQAQAQVGITRAEQFPQRERRASDTQRKRFPGFAFNVLQLQALFSWDIDFWGKYRRATEAARANLLATEWGRRQVIEHARFQRCRWRTFSCASSTRSWRLRSGRSRRAKNRCSLRRRFRKRRRGRAAGRSPGRATGRNRGGDDSRGRARDRATGRSDQHADGRESA